MDLRMGTNTWVGTQTHDSIGTPDLQTYPVMGVDTSSAHAHVGYALKAWYTYECVG